MQEFKYEYVFANGEVSSGMVEISDELWVEIDSFNREEQRSNARNEGKHLKCGRTASLDMCLETDESSMSDGSDILADIIARESRRENRKYLCTAVNELKPWQYELVQQIYVQNRKARDIAKEKGVSEQAVAQQLKRIHQRLQKSIANW